MKTVCSYCHRQISGSRRAKHVSHGICKKCYRKLMHRHLPRRNPVDLSRKNMLTKGAGLLKDWVLGDPRLKFRFRVLKARLAAELKRGRFNKMKWLRAAYRLARLAARHYAQSNNIKKPSRRLVIRTAYLLARRLWEETR